MNSVNLISLIIKMSQPLSNQPHLGFTKVLIA